MGITCENLFDDLGDAVNLKMNVKRALPILEKPGNWDSKVTNGTYACAGSRLAETCIFNKGAFLLTSALTPIVGATKAREAQVHNLGKVPSSLTKAFPTGRLLDDKPNILKCNHCKRPVSKHAMPDHIQGCLNKKQEKQRKKKEAKDARDAAARKEKNSQVDSDDDEGEGGKKTAAGKGGGLTASKKRKATDDGEEGPGSGPTKKKKKKEDPKAKAPRPKAPVDVEKQCGVDLPQGGQCARSLTCKSHSMGAKRAVPGRSAPYDKLLMDYQRKNQAKLQKAAFDANAPNPDDDSLPSGPIDSEEEKDAVMSAIARSWGGRPIWQPTLVPLRKRYEFNRIKGMLGSALAGRGGASIFGNGGGGGGFFGPAPTTQTNHPITDSDGTAAVHARKGSMVPGARNLMAPASGHARKGSVPTAIAT